MMQHRARGSSTSYSVSAQFQGTKTNTLLHTYTYTHTLTQVDRVSYDVGCSSCTKTKHALRIYCTLYMLCTVYIRRVDKWGGFWCVSVYVYMLSKNVGVWVCMCVCQAARACKRDDKVHFITLKHLNTFQSSD